MDTFCEELESRSDRFMRKVRLGHLNAMFPAQLSVFPQRTSLKKKRPSKTPESRNGNSVDKRSETVKDSKASLGRQETTCESKPSEVFFREERSLAFETPRRIGAIAAEQRSNTADKDKKPQAKPKSKRSVRAVPLEDTTSVLSLSRLSSQLPGYRPASLAFTEGYQNDFTLFMNYEELNTSQGYLVSDIFDRVNRHLLPQISNPILARTFMESRFPIPQCYVGLTECFNAIELSLFRLMSAKTLFSFSDLKNEAFQFSKWYVVLA